MPHAVAHTGFFCMGTRCHLVLPGVPPEEAAPLFRLLRRELERVEDLLSWFRPHSELSRVNREAARADVSVGEELMGLLLACRDAHRRTLGRFDPTLRPLSDEPDPALRERLLPELGMRHLRLDPDRGTVRFDSPRLRLDAGGFGKGYALDRAAAILRRTGFHDALLSIGESSIIGVGRHPAGDGWPIGIRDARDPEAHVGRFRLRNSALSTSGTFQPAPDGTPRRNPHIVDPATGHPVDELLTVSCTATSAMEAEFWSTALLTLPEADWEEPPESPEPPDGLNALRVAYPPESGAPRTTRRTWPATPPASAPASPLAPPLSGTPHNPSITRLAP